MRFTDQFIQDLRDRIKISDVIGTRVSWDRAKTRPQRGDYWGCCPMHGESRPSFHCEDRKGRYHCFGCGATGDHFKFFTELDGVSFPRAVEMVASLAGVNLPGREETEAERKARQKRETDRKRRDERKAADDARAKAVKLDTVKGIWQSAIPIEGTLAEAYLNSRSIARTDLGDGPWPPSIRFHPGLTINGAKHPALIGGVQAVDRKLVAVWRIPLDASGRAIVDSEGKKIKLGLGPASGGGVRLGPVTKTLRVAEGLETALAVQRLTSREASTWALLSTSGMIAFEIPPGVERVEIYADGDRHRMNKITGALMQPPGIAAAKQLQEKAKAKGVEAVIYPSPEPDDWLDVWQARKKNEQRERNIQYLD